MNYKPVSLSGADPAGILYTDGKRYLRGVHDEGLVSVNKLLDSGLIETLWQKGLIPKTTVLDKGSIPVALAAYPLVLEHESIEPLSYPREWSFEMLKEVALAFIDLVKTLYTKGFTCKDAHLFNWAFRGIHPVWLDISSFELVNKKGSGIPWITEFFTSILGPLLMWGKGMPFLASKAVSSPIQTPPLEESLLALQSNFGYQIPIIRNILLKINKIIVTRNITVSTIITRLLKPLLGDLFYTHIKSLRKRVKNITFLSSSTWGQYHNDFLDTHGHIIFDTRFKRIIELLNEYTPSSVLELAGNAGVVSQAIAEKYPELHVLCTDYDPNAIDCFFRRVHQNAPSNLYMAVLNFMVPENSSAETAPDLRFRSDCVLALAVTHHLLLGQGYNYDQVFSAIATYSKKIVFIEFMPLGLHDGVSAPPTPPWYTQKEFQKSFCDYFELLKIEQLDENRVLFIGQIK